MTEAAYLRYFPNGRIKSWGTCPVPDLSNQNRVGQILRSIAPADLVNYTEKYIDVSGGIVSTHFIADKPVMPSFAVSTVTIKADGIESAILSGLPVGTVVTIDGMQTANVDDGTFVVTAVVSANIRLEIERFPFLPEVVFISALDTI